MKLSPKQRKKMNTVEAIRDEYPYGLRLDLNTEVLKKLGEDADTFPIEGKIKISAIAQVESVRKSASKTDASQSVCLQITDLSIDGKTGPKKTLKQAKKALMSK